MSNLEDDPRTCVWPECEAFSDALGLCGKHYARLKRGGLPGCDSLEEEVVVAWLRVVGAEAEDDEWFAGALQEALRVTRKLGTKKAALSEQAQKGHAARWHANGKASP